MFLSKKYSAWIENLVKAVYHDTMAKEIRICASAYQNKLNYVKSVLNSNKMGKQNLENAEAIAAYLYAVDVLNMRRLNGLITEQPIHVLVIAANCTTGKYQTRFRSNVAAMALYAQYCYDAKNNYIYGAVTAFDPGKSKLKNIEKIRSYADVQLNHASIEDVNTAAYGRSMVDRAISVEDNIDDIARNLANNPRYKVHCYEQLYMQQYNRLYLDSGEGTQRKLNKAKYAKDDDLYEYERQFTSGCGQTSNYSSGCGQTGSYSSGCGQSCSQQSGCGYTSSHQSGCGYTSRYQSGCGSSYQSGC